MAECLHVRGPVLTGPDEIRDELWVLDGRVTFTAPSRTDVTTVSGWALPGLVDAHCHVGLGADGPVDAPTALDQARTDRDAGTLLIHDAGSPVDTRFQDLGAGYYASRTDKDRKTRAHVRQLEALGFTVSLATAA